MQSGCRWVYTLMAWETGEVVAKGTSVELVEQGYFPDVNKLSSVWNNLGVNEEKTGLLVYEVPEDSKDYSISYLEQFSNDTEGDVFFVFFTAKDK